MWCNFCKRCSIKLVWLLKLSSIKYLRGFQFLSFLIYAAQKKWNFSLKTFAVNVTNFAVNWGFGHIYWRNPLWKTLFLCSNIIVSKKSAILHLSFINLIKVIKTTVEHCINVFILTFVQAFTIWNDGEKIQFQ